MIIRDPADVSALLKQARADAHQSMYAFADTIGIDQRRISLYERNKQGLHVRTLIDVLARLGMVLAVVKANP